MGVGPTAGSRPPLVTVVGTNASGKSRLGIALAKEFDGEVVSADSRQVYRGLDLGAGKVTIDEMDGVPHHLLDVADPAVDRFSLADFQRLAYESIDSIHERGRLPIMVGGTGLYVRAVTAGYVLAPAPPNHRRRMELDRLDDTTLWRMLHRSDPDRAAAIDSRNRRRVIRAIEIIEQGSRLATASSNSPRYRVLQLGVSWPESVLKQRIRQRLTDRLKAGMIDEARDLLQRGVTLDRMDELGLEYRYLAWFLTGRFDNESEFFEALATAIYRFSRRQMAWFRRDAHTIWLNTDGDYLSQAVDAVRRFIGQGAAHSVSQG